MTLAQVHATPGLAAYMAEVEARLARAVAARPGSSQEVAGEALAAGGKRLRPLLCFLTRRAASRRVAAGVAVELVHMATLVHDDLVDGARLRRGLPAAWSVYGADAAKAAGDYLYARAFAVLAETGDDRAVRTLADAALCLARGEAMQQLPDERPGHGDRCVPRALRPEDGEVVRGRVPARLGGEYARAYGVALGIAFQIADDILDCAGQTHETGKIPGTDLREGTPTLPLLLAAREDAVVRARARRRAARRRARSRRCDRRARAVARGCARLRGARAPASASSAPRGARSADLRGRGPRGLSGDPPRPHLAT